MRRAMPSARDDPAGAGRGDIVICDRFMDSTRVYQGYAGGCDMALIDVLERMIVGARPAGS